MTALRPLAIVLLLAAAAQAEERRTIYIQPLGEALPDDDVRMVVDALVEFYGLQVKALPRVPLPKSAWYAPRKRHRAEKLLEFLATRLPPDGVRVLGLTAGDISTTKGAVYDWGVLGLGALPGTTCVISSFRCHKRSRGPLHARERLAKVAVHEIGHTLGLDHCPTVGCLLEDAQGKVATCDREYDLCPRCRSRVAANGHRIPAAPKIPWPKP